MSNFELKNMQEDKNTRWIWMWMNMQDVSITVEINVHFEMNGAN